MMARRGAYSGSDGSCRTVEEVGYADEEGVLIQLHVFDIGLEEAITEEGLLKLARQGLDQILRIRCREECLMRISLSSSDAMFRAYRA